MCSFLIALEDTWYTECQQVYLAVQKWLSIEHGTQVATLLFTLVFVFVFVCVCDSGSYKLISTSKLSIMLYIGCKLVSVW